MWGTSVFLSALATFPSQEGGVGAKRPHHQIFGTSYIRAHSMRNDCQILHDDQTKYEENLYIDEHESVYSS